MDLIILSSLVPLMMRFNFFGIRLCVSFWALLFVSYGIIFSGTGKHFILICLISSFFHEIGHLFFIFKFSDSLSEIQIHPFEVRINCSLDKVTFKQDVLITSSGILVNLLLASVFCLLYYTFQNELCLEISLCNLAIGAFNFLPIDSTDGGQLLSMILSLFLDYRIRSLLITFVSCFIIIVLIFSGVYVLFISRYNFSLLFIGIYFLIIFINKELR